MFEDEWLLALHPHSHTMRWDGAGLHGRRYVEEELVISQTARQPESESESDSDRMKLPWAA